MSEPFKLRYVNQIVGGFILLLVFVLLGFILYFVRAKELFVRSLPYEMVIQQHELDGLRQGTEVIVLGHTAGRITNIEYLDDGSDLKVSLVIKETFQKSLFEDSVVRLRRRFGVGEPYLEILRGPRGARLLDQPEINAPVRLPAFVPEEDRVDQLAMQMEKVRQAVERVEAAMVPALVSIKGSAEPVGPSAKQVGDASTSVAKSAQDMQKKFDETLKYVDASTGQFNKHLDEVGKTVKTLELDSQKTMAEVRQSTTTFSDSILNVKGSANSAFNQLRDASRDMQVVMRESQQVVADLKAETQDLRGTSGKLNDAADGAQDVIDGLKQHWLLKRYIKPTTSSRQLPPSGIRGAGR